MTGGIGRVLCEMSEVDAGVNAFDGLEHMMVAFWSHSGRILVSIPSVQHAPVCPLG